MGRKKESKTAVCPVCGTRVEPTRTWNLVSPIPDSKGRITITVMGSFECPNCGRKWRGVVSKIKVGGAGVEVEAGGSKKVLGGEGEVKREGEVIELDVEEILSEPEEE